MTSAIGEIEVDRINIVAGDRDVLVVEDDTCMYALTRNYQDQKTMNHELVQFINSFTTPVRIVEIDAFQRPVYSQFNDAALEDDGLCHEQIVGRTAAEIYPGIIGEIATNRHQAVVNSGESLVFDLDHYGTGGKKSIRTTLAPMLNEQGKVVKIFSTQVDIAEKIVQSVQSNTEEKIQEMEQYIALAAHDLRTPMRNVSAIAEIMKEDFEDLGDGKIRMILMLEEMSNKALELISEILSYAEATSKQEPEVSIFQLDELCSNIISVLDPLGLNTLTCDSFSVSADKIPVQIAMNNLIDNAIKHNDSREVHLNVSVSQVTSDFIEVQVADNGIGFEESALLFVESRKLRSSSGFGLLGISRMIRERGGDMRAESKCAEGGAVISFTIPGTLLNSLSCTT